MIPLPNQIYTREARLDHLAIALLDIDHFKQLNDRYGHAAGDRVLQQVAAHLENELRVRGTDLVWRHGGEEFGVAFVGAGREAVLKKLGGRVNVPVEVNGENIIVTLSGGVAEFRPGEDINETLERADQALYKAKRAGRDRILPSAEVEK
jgi:diguanylate cyclase